MYRYNPFLCFFMGAGYVVCVDFIIVKNIVKNLSYRPKWVLSLYIKLNVQIGGKNIICKDRLLTLFTLCKIIRKIKSIFTLKLFPEYVKIRCTLNLHTNQGAIIAL